MRQLLIAHSRLPTHVSEYLSELESDNSSLVRASFLAARVSSLLVTVEGFETPSWTEFFQGVQPEAVTSEDFDEKQGGYFIPDDDTDDMLRTWEAYVRRCYRVTI